ncbi:hypothetical protein TVAG_496430, partial [Trichomonas vaginalis G3]
LLLLHSMRAHTLTHSELTRMTSKKKVESLERSKCCLSSSVETLHRSMRRKN